MAEADLSAPFPFDAEHLAGDDDFKNRPKRRLREAPFGMRFCVADENVSSVVAGGVLQIEAMASPFGVRDGDGAPLVRRNFLNRRIRTRTYGGVAGASGLSLTLCRSNGVTGV